MDSPASPGLDLSAQEDALQEAVALLRSLGHAGRLGILCHLIGQEQTVGALTQALGRSQPAVSQQLMRLRAEGLVAARREGRQMLYSIARPEVSTVVAALRDSFCQPAL